MWPRSLIVAYVFLVLAALLFYVGGCGNNPDAGTSTNASSLSGGQANALPPSKPLLKDWPKPAFVLMLTGERHGYLEPCGCSPTQSGGLSRLADLFRQVEQKSWPIVPLDLGGTIRRDRLQSQYKFATTLRALKDLSYAGLALGIDELRLELMQPGFLLTQIVTDPNKPDAGLPFLAANIVFFNDPNIGIPTRSRIVSAGNKKVGVTAIFGKGYRSNILAEGAKTDITIQDPETALPAVIDNLKKQSPDLLVLLSHADKDESRALAKAFPDFDVVLTAGGPEDGDEQPEKIGDKTWLLDVGHKGKYAGVLGFYPDDAANRLRFELVDLDKGRFHETPKMHDHMREYQELLRDNYELILNDLPKAPHPSGSQYVGAARCGKCHTKAYQKWKIDSDDDPHHSRAFKSLSIGRKGEEKNWIPRIHDPECLACHVTGWDPQEVFAYDSGFISQEKTPLLTAQQCENCHGPGSKHTELEERWLKDRKSVADDQLTAERKAVKLTVEVAEKQVCTRCHDYENSPGYKFEKYWEKIKHPGKD